MEPISLILIALFASAGAAAVIATLSWNTVHQFVTSRSVRNGTARIIRKRLSTGNYEIIAGVLGSSGATIATQSWTAQTVDADLASRFGAQNVIVVKT